MNDIAAFALNLVITLLISLLLVAYLAPSMLRILIDLCGTQERARFWLSFSQILLVGLPVVSALAYQPGLNTMESWFFDVAHQLARTAMTLLLTVIGLGLVITFFAAVAPRARKENAS